jgi:tetratricopeptide (TPR) repeat protein
MNVPEERWERVGALFHRARSMPPARRAGFLRRVCPDPDLRAEVEDLLLAHEQLEAGADPGFLDPVDRSRVRAFLESSEPPPGDREDLEPGAVVGRYQVLRPLGQGGMAVVVLARDRRLRRRVALKLLPGSLGLDEIARHRFEEEARAASALDHPNVATIYEIGDCADGGAFIAMAYCEGETLREELRRGPLSIQRVLSLAVQLVDGLSAAHRRGIVHRDIKPENVIVSPQGIARIVDFGVATMTGREGREEGVLVGTVAYMSPEQTRQDTSDPAVDVWAMGVTLYELLAGQRPFAAERKEALILAIRNDEPRALHSIRPDLPVGLDRIIQRCLTKDREDRYRNAGELLADLQRVNVSSPAPVESGRGIPLDLVGPVAAVGLVVTVGIWAWAGPGGAGVEPASVFATDANRLAAIPVQPPERARTGAGAGAPASAEAYGEYLRGRHFLGKRDERSFAAARNHFQRSVDLDPTFAAAWGGLADAYDRLATLAGLPAHEAYPRARAAAQRALLLDPGSAEAHTALGATLSSYDWDSEAAQRHLRRALLLDPGNARTYEAYAKHLRNLGRFEEALVQARKAQELDPLSASPHIEEAITLYLAGRHDEAIQKLRRLLAAQPDLTYAHHGLALNLAQQRRYDEALSALDGVDPPHLNTHAIRGVISAMAGREAEARRVLETLEMPDGAPLVSSFHRAAIHTALGEHDRAFELLEEGFEIRASYLRLLGVEPIFIPLRDDPRFLDLLQRLGLEG